MTSIGIVGAGIAGLHLSLFLQQRGMSVTLYAEHTPEQQLTSRLPSIVTRFGPTRDRERALGVNHWDFPDFGVFCFHVHVTGDYPLAFCGHLSQPALVVDMRIYQATLLQDFSSRGGQVVFGTLQASDLERLTEQHDLVVVATGRGNLTGLFPEIPEHSPFTAPQRRLFAGLFRGVTYSDPPGITFTVMPGIGEISAIPIYSFEGRQSALFGAAVPGGPFDILTQMRYEDDPQRFEATLLDLLREHAPPIYARIDPAAFGLTRPVDLVQGAVTPVVRRGYAQLPNGRWVLAHGDAHVLNDPCIAQGANAASHAAWVIGEAILEQTTYDEAFCREVEQRVWQYLEAATAWTNQTLQPPAYTAESFVAAAQNQAIANAVTDNFADPVRGWSVMRSPAGLAEFLQGFGWTMASDTAVGD